MFVGNYDGLQKGYKICQLSRKIAFKSIPFSTISGVIQTKAEPFADPAFLNEITAFRKLRDT